MYLTATRLAYLIPTEVLKNVFELFRQQMPTTGVHAMCEILVQLTFSY